MLDLVVAPLLSRFAEPLVGFPAAPVRSLSEASQSRFRVRSPTGQYLLGRALSSFSFLVGPDERENDPKNEKGHARVPKVSAWAEAIDNETAVARFVRPNLLLIEPAKVQAQAQRNQTEQKRHPFPLYKGKKPGEKQAEVGQPGKLAQEHAQPAEQQQDNAEPGDNFWIKGVLDGQGRQATGDSVEHHTGIKGLAKGKHSCFRCAAAYSLDLVKRRLGFAEKLVLDHPTLKRTKALQTLLLFTRLESGIKRVSARRFCDAYLSLASSIATEKSIIVISPYFEGSNALFNLGA